MSIDQLIEQSVNQGLDYLKQNRNQDILSPKEAIFNITSRFNRVSAANNEAEGLEAALDRNIGHSGSTFGLALGETLNRAMTELHARATYNDQDGLPHPITRYDTSIPENATRLVLKF